MRARHNVDTHGPTNGSGFLGRALVVIGWSEMVDLPEWGIDQLKAKIDTGAHISAIHVDAIKRLPRNRVQFDVITEIDHRTHRMERVRIEAPIVRTARVRPTHGEDQERPVVSTVIRLGPIEQSIELSLVCRKHMRFRLLLGRLALKKHFLIDPTHANLLQRPSARRGDR